MFSPLIALAALTLPVAATAQDAAQGSPPQRIRNVQLLPGETCPKAQGDEVVVCATLSDQFRIPSNLREPANPAANQSWASRAEAAMDDNRKVLPGSCSPVGSNGATGCAQKAAEAWAAERRAQASAAVPQ
jgi:hypothetical protein